MLWSTLNKHLLGSALGQSVAEALAGGADRRAEGRNGVSVAIEDHKYAREIHSTDNIAPALSTRPSWLTSSSTPPPTRTGAVLIFCL